MNNIQECLKVWIICQLILLKVSRATIKEAPFLVRLLYEEMFCCGGTLVTPKYVVTAAHCVRRKHFESFTIIAGVTYSNETGERSKVDDIMFPKNYVQLVIDVAVLKLRSPVSGLHIQPIALCNTTWSWRDNVQIYGWGKVNESGKSASSQMRTATVQLFKRKACAYLYRNIIKIRKNKMFCASIPGRKAACDGDSGGPAIINGKFCGVISFSKGCARHLYPGVYTNVRAVRKFITRHIKRL